MRSDLNRRKSNVILRSALENAIPHIQNILWVTKLVEKFLEKDVSVERIKLFLKEMYNSIDDPTKRVDLKILLMYIEEAEKRWSEIG